MVVKADTAGKVDVICRNYPNIVGIVDGYTEWLQYMIVKENYLIASRSLEG